MSTDAASPPEVEAHKQPRDFELKRFHVDLRTKAVRCERIRCEDVEDVLGGAARGYKRLIGNPVDDAYDPNALLILNLGLLTGSQLMTSLRTFFHAYSPLKIGKSGKRVHHDEKARRRGDALRLRETEQMKCGGKEDPATDADHAADESDGSANG